MKLLTRICWHIYQNISIIITFILTHQVILNDNTYKQQKKAFYYQKFLASVVRILINKLQGFKKFIVSMYQKMHIDDNFSAQSTCIKTTTYQKCGLLESTQQAYQSNQQKLPENLQQNLLTLKHNIIQFCQVLSNPTSASQIIQNYQKQLLMQLQNIQQYQKLGIISNKSIQNIDLQLEKKINNFIEVLEYLYTLKEYNKDQSVIQTYQAMIISYLQQMKKIIKQQCKTLQKLKKYDVYADTLTNNSKFQLYERKLLLKPSHYSKQLLKFDIQLSPEVFESIEPRSHAKYVSEVSKAFHIITPFKIKYIVKPSIYSQNKQDLPHINIVNYFHIECEKQKKVLCLPITDSNKIIRYNIPDISNQFTIGKEFCNETVMNIKWNFSKDTKVAITNFGRLFAINCRDQQNFIDDTLYQIVDNKIISKSSRIPEPCKQSGFVYLNNNLYVIGGSIGDKCFKKNWKYSLKEKIWIRIEQSNIAIRKPTLCTFNNRFIIKIGGISQFNYINKVIEIYDSLKNTWSIVRASPKNILEQVEILEDSLAVQINDYQIYVFGGKNVNKFCKDSGFVLNIIEITEKAKKPIKVKGQLWNVTIGYKNILSFFGLLNMSNIIIHNNCIYTLRNSLTQPMIN